jgi:hypothetical protein
MEEAVATPKDHPLGDGRYGQFDRRATPIATDLYWGRAVQILSKASKMEEHDARGWFLAKAEYYIGPILESALENFEKKHQKLLEESKKK